MLQVNPGAVHKIGVYYINVSTSKELAIKNVKLLKDYYWVPVPLPAW